MSSESEIIEKFRERVKRGTLNDDVRVVYRISGGMPSERVDEEFNLSGNGKATVRSLDILKSRTFKEATADLTQGEVSEAFQKVEKSLDKLVPFSEARFMPDSIVGSITIEEGGKKTTLYFQEEETVPTENIRGASPEISVISRYFREASQCILKKAHGGMP
jgi:hypothetical protein